MDAVTDRQNALSCRAASEQEALEPGTSSGRVGRERAHTLSPIVIADFGERWDRIERSEAGIRRRPGDRCRKQLRVAARLYDGYFLVVADAPVDIVKSVSLPAFADRADKVSRRLCLSKRSPGQGSNQAQQEHC